MSEDIEMLDFEAFKERYEKVPVEEYPNNVRETVPDPVVSVHLLTYNHADYIEEAIESVLMQEVDFPMEIVLGDDDSSDGTREICIEYAKQYPDLIRLQLHHRENNIHLHGGPTHLFQYWYNTLSARGKYIAILSGDDYWTDPLKLQKQCDFLKANTDYALSFHDAYVVNEYGQVIAESALPKKSKSNFSKEELMRWEYTVPSTYLAKNVFYEVPSISMSLLHEDVLTIALIGKRGAGKYQGRVEPTAYRIHGRSVWKSRSRSEKKETLSRAWLKMSVYFDQKNIKKISKKYIGRHIHSEYGIARVHLSKREYSRYIFKIIDVLKKCIRFNYPAKLTLILKCELSRLLSSVIKKIN